MRRQTPTEIKTNTGIQIIELLVKGCSHHGTRATSDNKQKGEEKQILILPISLMFFPAVVQSLQLIVNWGCLHFQVEGREKRRGRERGEGREREKLSVYCESIFTENTLSFQALHLRHQHLWCRIRRISHLINPLLMLKSDLRVTGLLWDLDSAIPLPTEI